MVGCGVKMLEGRVKRQGGFGHLIPCSLSLMTPVLELENKCLRGKEGREAPASRRNEIQYSILKIQDSRFKSSK